MKITKTTDGDLTTYFYDGVKKYEHYKDSAGYETWKEYKDGKQIHFKNSIGYESWTEYKDGEEIHYKNSDGDETWSDNNPENPKNFIIKEEDIKPFEFNN